MALTRYLFVDELGNRDDDKYEPGLHPVLYYLNNDFRLIKPTFGGMPNGIPIEAPKRNLVSDEDLGKDDLVLDKLALYSALLAARADPGSASTMALQAGVSPGGKYLRTTFKDGTSLPWVETATGFDNGGVVSYQWHDWQELLLHLYGAQPRDQAPDILNSEGFRDFERALYEPAPEVYFIGMRHSRNADDWSEFRIWSYNSHTREIEWFRPFFFTGSALSSHEVAQYAAIVNDPTYLSPVELQRMRKRIGEMAAIDSCIKVAKRVELDELFYIAVKTLYAKDKDE